MQDYLILPHSRTRDGKIAKKHTSSYTCANATVVDMLSSDFPRRSSCGVKRSCVLGSVLFDSRGHGAGAPTRRTAGLVVNARSIKTGRNRDGDSQVDACLAVIWYGSPVPCSCKMTLFPCTEPCGPLSEPHHCPTPAINIVIPRGQKSKMDELIWTHLRQWRPQRVFNHPAATSKSKVYVNSLVKLIRSLVIPREGRLWAKDFTFTLVFALSVHPPTQWRRPSSGADG